MLGCRLNKLNTFSSLWAENQKTKRQIEEIKKSWSCEKKRPETSNLLSKGTAWPSETLSVQKLRHTYKSSYSELRGEGHGLRVQLGTETADCHLLEWLVYPALDAYSVPYHMLVKTKNEEFAKDSIEALTWWGLIHSVPQISTADHDVLGVCLHFTKHFKRKSISKGYIWYGFIYVVFMPRCNYKWQTTDHWLPVIKAEGIHYRGVGDILG